MAWTDPPVFVSGGTVTAAQLNILGDDLVYLKGITDGVSFSGTKLIRSTSQSLTTATYTDITLTAETFDYGGWWSSGPTVTVPAGAIPTGYTSVAVLLIGLLRYVANGTGSRQLRILLNGSEVETVVHSALSGEKTTVHYSTVFTVEAADEIKMQGYQSSGGALNIDNARLTIVRYAPAT
jgi:hypothetical protein